MKHEWKKEEKQYYLPKSRPEIIQIPAFKFFTIEGQGNPNDAFFADYIGVLYSLSYAVKMSPKKGQTPEGYIDYTVYPLEGIWSLTQQAIQAYQGTIDKNDLVFKLMIRQPDFVSENFAAEILHNTKKGKPHPLLDKIKFEQITDGLSVQMLHTGSYDNEPQSFEVMEQFAQQQQLERIQKTHREIYLSDARRVPTEKLKTVLRFGVENKA